MQQPDMLPQFTQVTCRYREHVLRLTVPAGESFLAGDIFLRNEYPLTGLKGVFRKPVIVDVGANVGLFALYMHLNIKGAVIHCFEPSAALCGALRRNLAGCPEVRLHAVALSDHDGRELFNLNTRKAGQSSLHSVTGPQGEGWVREHVDVRHAGRAFDELGIDHADILKIDTEGSEPEILESLGPRLDGVKHLYIEYHSLRDLARIRALLSGFEETSCVARGDAVGVLRFMHRSLR
ncbi:FkbM family methyltransferase [Oleidesulfovibrio alaskensis]|jgi:FkbM family methyltransferase|uniref:FkbM family methyltransferase n=1 Tax=Oleidesulfovibrio alaskensis TaxID=58180 RepID=UPI000415194A|nr:FkbM family methyltransferase [Oleidesulfovibrio alaskensis]